MNREPRLSLTAADALCVLRGVANTTEEVSMTDAERALADDDRFEGDAANALALLEARGYIYFVNETVRITPTDE